MILIKLQKILKSLYLIPDQNRERPEASQDPIRTNLTIRVVDFYGDQK